MTAPHDDDATVPPAGDADSSARWAAVITLVVLAFVAVASVLAVAPPAARGTDTPATEFAAARAAEHLAEIARAPHPVGVAEHDRVRDHIVDAARAAGADVTIETDDVARVEDRGPFVSARVENIVARVAGSAPETSGGRALVLAVHYDSVPTGPGAADDGAGVAALLEVMRALQAGAAALRNDVVFLFTDAEELGLLGAQGYVGRHGVDEIGAVLNFEARGSRGPVWMFETGRGNGPLVSAFADASPRPVASSLNDEVYKRLPNDTDFTVFLDAGATGLNAAFLDGVHDYHAASDTPERISADSMEHHGETMLALLRELGDTDLRELRGSDAVFFDVVARVVVRYPASLVVPIALVSVLALGAATWLGRRRGTLRVGGVLLTAGAGLAAAVLAAVVCAGLWQLVLLARPSIAALPLSEPYEQAWFTAGFALVTVTMLALTAWVLRRRTTAELVLGTLVVLGVLLLVTALLTPGASYLMQWPLVAALPAAWWFARGPRSGAGGDGHSGDGHSGDRAGGRRGWLGGAALLALGPIVAVTLFAPLFDGLLVALGIALAAVGALLVVLGGLVLVPLFAATRRTGLLAGGLAVAAVATLAVATADSGTTSAEPTSDGLVYVRDAADGTARWLSTGPADGWMAPLLGSEPATVAARAYLPHLGGYELLTAPAPDTALREPTVDVLADDTTGDTRTVRFVAGTARDAWQVQVRLQVEPLRACTVAGRTIDAETLRRGADDTGGALFQHFGAATNGLELTCDVEAGARLDVEVIDHSVGLAPEVARLAPPRPDTSTPYGSGMGLSDGVAVRTVVTV